MVEGGKKSEEMKSEEKKEEKKAEEPKSPPPRQEIVLRVYLHCEGCARKVRQSLKRFEGVEYVTTDCKTNMVVVKGEKADPTKVLERVQKKSHRQVELLSPIPKPPPPEDAKKPEEKEGAKPEEKKEEPQVTTVLLNIQMHCEACAKEIKRRVLRIEGVQKVEPDFNSSQVTVTGVFDSQKLIEYIHKRTGKHVSIVKQEPEKKKEKARGKPEDKEKKTGDKDKKKGEMEEIPEDTEKKTGNKDGESKKATAVEKKDGGEVAVVAATAADGENESGKVVEEKKNEFYYMYPVNFQMYPLPQMFDYNAYVHYTSAPQIFSDENPNACTVM